MNLSAADGAALLAAAVQAAIRERAPTRTVAAVAATVAGTFVSAAARQSPPATRAQARTMDAERANADVEADDPVQLFASLRAHRRTQPSKEKGAAQGCQASGNCCPRPSN